MAKNEQENPKPDIEETYPGITEQVGGFEAEALPGVISRSKVSWSLVRHDEPVSTCRINRWDSHRNRWDHAFCAPGVEVQDNAPHARVG